jgi:hypothetical protein
MNREGLGTLILSFGVFWDELMGLTVFIEVNFCEKVDFCAFQDLTELFLLTLIVKEARFLLLALLALST